MFDKMAGIRLIPALGLALLGLLIVATISLLLAGRSATGRQTLGTHVATLGVLAQSVPRLADDAARGDGSAFEGLRAEKDRIGAVREEIAEGASGIGFLSSPSAKLLSDMPGWDGFVANVDAILAEEETLLTAKTAADEIAGLVPEVLTATGNLLGTLGGASATNAPIVERFEITAQSLEQDVAAMMAGVGDVQAAAQRLANSRNFLGQVLDGLARGDSSLGIRALTTGASVSQLQAVESAYAALSAQVSTAISASDALETARLAATNLASDGKTLTDRLTEVVSGGASAAGAFGGLGFSLIVVTLSLLLGLGLAAIYYFSGDIRRTSESNAEQNERHQAAILTLLDELGSLADGDLTVQATVTEDITGAIADSINYAIEALRELVETINATAVALDSTAKQTEATASHLAGASETQSKQVAAATESVSHMAASVEEVSGNAERSADVARHSVDVAHKGGDAVRRTIDGMNTIRETIQETSKRIKRLGESSQEIGNIVELINDIAEQTNILALNASIQASMAGEAGRGFAVVADEVQRLAERSANATKQIEVLVRTIQSDTNEAVVSMERSTTDVVGGALLAENAGAALDEIEQVSNQIASLVQNISSSAREQATAAGDISRNMGVLREVSSQTAESTTATSVSIKKLSELAGQLRQSISGFRLPDESAPPAPTVSQDVADSGEFEITEIEPDAPEPEEEQVQRA